MLVPGKISCANYINSLASVLPLAFLLSVLEINRLSEHLVTCSSCSFPEFSFKSCRTETLFDCGRWSESRFSILQVSVEGSKNCDTVGNLQPSKQTLFESEKLKLCNYRPRLALRAPGVWDFQNFYTVCTRSCHPTHRLPLHPRKYSWYSFLVEAESNPHYSRAGRINLLAPEFYI
jgi:hypothetical protein